MPLFEYKTVPAPRKGEKAKGVKTPDARFALAMQTLLNTHAAQGWEYQRAETLPMEERSGFTSKTVSDRSILIFRRALEVEQDYAPAYVSPANAPLMTANEHHEPAVKTVEEHHADAASASTFQVTGLRATRE